MAQSSNRPGSDALGRGALAGLPPFAIGHLMTYAWRAPSASDSLRGMNVLARPLGVDAIPTWRCVGWLFFGANGDVTRFPTPGGGAELVDMVERTGDGTVAVSYLLVPLRPVLAGAATARSGVAVDAVGAAMAGATVAVGSVIMAALGTFLFAHGIGDTGTSIAPEPITGVLLAGLVYPAVFGAIGGGLSSYR